jgi:hypothetical protein
MNDGYHETQLPPVAHCPNLNTPIISVFCYCHTAEGGEALARSGVYLKTDDDDRCYTYTMSESESGPEGEGNSATTALTGEDPVSLSVMQ